MLPCVESNNRTAGHGLGHGQAYAVRIIKCLDDFIDIIKIISHNKKLKRRFHFNNISNLPWQYGDEGSFNKRVFFAVKRRVPSPSLISHNLDIGWIRGVVGAEITSMSKLHSLVSSSLEQ